MNEGLGQYERGPVSDEAMIDALEKRGLSDPETRKMYDAWYTGHEAEADRIGTNAARMQVAVRRAVVYYKAGYKSEAIADLVDTLDGVISMNEQHAEAQRLAKYIQELLVLMRAGSGVK